MNAPLPESIRKALETVSLDDKYALENGRALMSGVQALVRLPMLQKKRDAHERAEHRRLRQRLPRLAAGRLRPVAVAGEEAPGRAEHRVPARRQRGTRGDRGVGHAAARPVPAEQEVRRRVRHLVRQGPGRGPLLRRVQARQHGRHREARRRDRAGRRRPCREEQHRRAPERPHLQGLRAAGVLPEQRAGHPRHGSARVRAEPLRGRVVGHEDDPGDRRVDLQRVRRPGPGRHRDPDRLRDARRRRAHPLARHGAASRKRG